MKQVNPKKYKKSCVDWLGDIPEQWEVSPLKKAIKSYIGGAWGDDEAGNQNDVICIRVADFDYDNFSISSSNLTLRNFPKLKKYLLLNRRSILLEKSGGGEKQLVGRAVSFSLNKRAICSNFIEKLDVNDNYLPRYIVYLFAGLYAAKVNGKAIKQTTGIQNLDLQYFLQNLVPLAPFETQKRIVDFLDEKTKIIDELIEKKERLVELLREKRASLITRAVTKGLDPKAKMKPSGVDWLGDIPEGWGICRIRFLVKTNPSKSEVSRLSNQMVSFLPMSHVSEYGNLNLSEERELNFVYYGYTYFQDGDVILAKITPCFENGKGAFVYGLTNKIGFGSTEFHVFRPRKIQGKFLFYFFKCDPFKKFGELNMKGTAGQKRVPELFIKDFIICLPPDHEQKRISNFLDTETAKIDKAVELIESQIEKLKEYRSSLIYHAVTGKIEI
jgi:type I restriction enzyme S subunit